MALISLETEGRVGIVRMANGAENRFSPPFVAEMMALLDEIEADDAIGAVVLTGTDPKFFCNGLDLEWLMGNASDPGALQGYLGSINAMFRRWTVYPKPTVAALNGHTFAAGLFLAAHLDFRLMRQDRGWVCLPEVDINIPLLPGMIAICQAVMPPQGFRRMYYTGQRFTAPQAMEIGFVDAVHAEDELLPASVEFATMLAGKNTRTYAEMKRRLRGDVAHILDEVDPEYFLAGLAFAMPQETS
jgi:enoyl-CoA hydratase/carnithine racemase